VTAARISGVIFDLDGTLYCVPGQRVRLTVALWRSIDVLRHLSAARRDLRARQFPSEEALREALFQELARRAEITPSSARAWYDHEFMEELGDMLANCATARPGLRDLLARLRGGGVKLAVVSDLGQVESRLRALGIDPDLFDDLISTEQHGVLKPSPKPLLALAQRWGLAPADIVVIGDRADLDGASAAAAGMPFFRVDNGAFPPWSKGLASWRRIAAELEGHTGSLE